MIIIFSDVQRQDFSVLRTLAQDVLLECCKISVTFLRKGSNPAVVKKAADALGLDAGSAGQGILALAHFFTECARMSIKQPDFLSSIAVLDFGDEANKRVWEFFEASVGTIRKLLGEKVIEVPMFDSLEWRLDVQVASRCLRQQAEPMYILKLKTKTKSGEVTTHLLQSDFANMKHMADELESALQEMQTSHVRKILRYVK